MKKINQLKFSLHVNSAGKIKKQLRFFPKDRISQVGLSLSFSLILIILITVSLLWSKLPPFVPLFYSRPWGENQLAKKSYLLILPLIMGLIIMLNLKLAKLISKKEALLSQIFIWTATVSTLLLDTTIIRILLLVI